MQERLLRSWSALPVCLTLLLCSDESTAPPPSEGTLAPAREYECEVEVARRVDGLGKLGQQYRTKIVCTQMTKTYVLAGGRRRDHLADLDIIVRDDHPVDEQFDELALLLEGGVLETAVEALAHGFDRRRKASQVPLLLLRIGLQLGELALHRLHLLLQARSTPLVFGERHDPLKIGLRQAVALAGEALPSLPQMGATRRQFLRRPWAPRGPQGPPGAGSKACAMLPGCSSTSQRSCQTTSSN